MYDISVLMIAREAEETIDNALSSVRGIASQIVVVDTGSVDRTPIIAARHNAEIHFFEWENNFSTARNYGLQFVRYPWVFVLDTDEVLDQESFKRNLSLFEQAHIGGIRVKITNHIKRGDSYTKTHHTYTRIFRRHPQIRFEGPIHEQIAQSILDAGFELVDSDILINHYGYNTINVDKINRNRKILEKQLESDPNDDWTLFHLAETEFSIGNLEKCLEIYPKLLDSSLLNPEQIEMSRIRLAQIALKTDSYSQVYDYIKFESEDPHREGLRLMILGTALLMEHRFEEARMVFNNPKLSLSDMVDKTQIQRALEIISFMSKKR
ncbi:MAG: glycosyltransferase [Candidatus Kapaibacteriales bacterium]